MALKIHRRGRESSHSLVRRFTKSIRESGILIRTRKKRFKQRRKSEQARKRAALRKEELKKEYEKLKKMGKPRK